MNMSLRCLVAGLLLLSGNALAVNYTLPGATFAPCQGTWTAGSNTCSGQISFASGDTLTSSSAITLVANAGFSLSGNVIGSSANPITLQASHGAIATVGSSASTLHGSVINSSGAITLSNITINGSIQTQSGTVTLTSSSVSGAITGTGTGNLTSTNVGGNVRFDNGITVNGGTLSGTVQSNGTASLSNTTVQGAVSATNGVTTSNANLNGSVTATNGTLSFTGGTINGNINGTCCKITISGATVVGNISNVNNEIEINNSTVTGTINNSNHRVNFSNSTIYGSVTAASWHTITGPNSKVYGSCSPAVTSPASLCDSSPISSCFTDSFDRASLGTDNWAVTSRNGSFGVPRTVGNRMRLTDNTGNVATGATLQRLLPATGNFVQVQFKYYAYNGNGADGVAVIFSDASITPQPGGYGGSLGYAQLNGTSGFAGGWLGIALDEYGNFSNPTETRIGGPGLRQDSVSIRGSGSGTSNYRSLAGTAANLNPGVDVSGATPGPGHIYRITLDSRTTGSTLVSVERNTGSGFSTLIAPFNAMANVNQTALPSDFFVSLTGSTGGSNNIHELDDFQVCATRINPIGQQIDHFEFSYAGQALTCNPQAVTVRACLNASCSSLYTDPVSVTLSPATGWSAVFPATLSGGNVLNFSGGTAAARLQRTTVGNLSIGVSNSSPATKPLSVPVCSTANCTISYADSGFLLDVPNMLAAKPTDASITAVRKADNAALCVPAFANVTRTIGFTAAYVEPNSGTQPVVVNGSNISAAVTNLSLSFDGNGRAPLTVRYNDAGQRSLSASYSGSAGTGDSGLQMNGTDLFVSKPYGLCLQTASTLAANTNCNDASCALFPGGIRAGDNFPLTIRAVGWEADGEALTAAQLCSGNITTPNFRLNGIALGSTVVAPTGGENGVVAPATYSHALGNSTIANRSVSEVGVFTITATPPAGGYLDGETVSGGTSALVGRFIPAYLGTGGSASLTPSCGSAFSYQGQPINFASGQEPLLTVTGYNRQGAVTRNYDRGAFWRRLGAPARDGYISVIADRPTLNSRLGLKPESSATPTALDAIVGDGSRAYRWIGEQLVYNPGLLPGSDDLPVAANVRQGFSAAALTDLDGACYLAGGSSCASYSFDFGGSDIRLGRLRIGNAHGPELQALSLPVSLESWQNVAGGSFQTEGLDNCTVLGSVGLSGFSGNLADGETGATMTGPAAGVGVVQLSAPGVGNDGSVQVGFPNAPAWLHYPWDGSARQAAVGLATFGIYKGAAPLIFRREVYR
ncbi:MSHA biogenesis protein MshQ [Pseudomonas sp. LjRoot71]|uniref:DUF6701 domain-containing protein n=1 Tax=Pseudomonas sp. LjRoot71 TaxID=3342336 RepID=UPI003ED0D266